MADTSNSNYVMCKHSWPSLGVGSLSVFLGGMIYISWRENSLLMFRWAQIFHMDNVVENLRELLRLFSGTMPAWFYYSLPNALWLFGGLTLLGALWGRDKMGAIFWCFTFCLLAFGAEFCQLLGFLPGTFDCVDLALMAAALIAAATFQRIHFIGEAHGSK